jgi:DNA primase
MTAHAATHHHHARDVRHALTDARQLCTALGLIAGHGTFKRQATGVLICCPAHEERDPSCSVHRGADGTLAVKCHACGFSGDALTLIAKARGLDLKTDFRRALRDGVEIAGLWALVDELDTGRRAPTLARTVPIALPEPEPAPPDDEYAELCADLLDACPLRAQPDVRGYLEERGIFAEAEARGLGALPPSPAQDPILARLAATHGLEALERAGLQSRDHGSFWSASYRLLIPWRDPDGRIVALQRRVLGHPVRREPKYLFPKGRRLSEHPFGVEHAAAALDLHARGGRVSEIVYVEGALDVLARHALNLRHDVAHGEIILGLPSVTRWVPSWASYAHGRVAVVALDEDAAGRRRIQEIARDLYEAGALDVKRAAPRAGKDWGDQLEESA